MSTHYFHAWCGSHKKYDVTRYIVLVFLHQVRSAGHVVHSGTSGVRNVDTLFSMLGERAVLIPQEAHRDTSRRTFVFAFSANCGSLSALWFVYGVKHQRTIFHALVAPVRMPQKASRGTSCHTFVFASGWTCGSHSTLWCIWGEKYR
jgi:hypothetical protein